MDEITQYWLAAKTGIRRTKKPRVFLDSGLGVIASSKSLVGRLLTHPGSGHSSPESLKIFLVVCDVEYSPLFRCECLSVAAESLVSQCLQNFALSRHDFDQHFVGIDGKGVHGGEEKGENQQKAPHRQTCSPLIRLPPPPRQRGEGRSHKRLPSPLPACGERARVRGKGQFSALIAG